MTPAAAPRTQFVEEQTFPRAMILTVLAVMVAAVAIPMLIRGEELTTGFLAILPAAVTILLVMRLRLVTRIEDGVLSARLFPFANRKIPLTEIAEAEVRDYRPLREYGGWGVRFGRNGMAYNARGHRGVQLVLSDGKRVLIGSQKPEELLEAIQDGRAP